jgi:predicted dehydrogenase
MTKKLKVGIAGYGVVGKRRRECVDQNKLVEMVAVCDQIFLDEVSIVDGIRGYKNYKKLLEEELDILIVCLTNDIAPEVTIAALNAGLHVFCEKPPGRNVSDIIKVIDVEKNNPNLKLMYGFNHRYHHSVQDALKLVHSGELGKIINIRGVYGKAKLITFNQPDWRTKREISGGGVLLDQGVHMVDLIRLFGGEFEDIYSFVSNSHWGYNVEDNAYALMKTNDGIVAMMHSSATQWRHRFNLDMNLEKGSVILGGILSGTKSYGAETLTVVRADPENDLGDPMEQVTRYNKDPSWFAEIDEFIKCIIGDKRIINGTSDDALQTMKLVYKIYYSDYSWREKYGIPDPNSD